MSEWHEDVYHASQFPKDSQEYWERVKEFIIERDGFRCKACRKKGKIKDFTVHHIIPRVEGGTDDPVNLLTLCFQCHDYVEAKGYKQPGQIFNCTKFLDKGEIKRVIFNPKQEIISPEIEKPQPEIEPEETDRVEIVCPCGIYHIRGKKESEKINEIHCICQRTGIKKNGVWEWSFTRVKEKPKTIKKPQTVVKEKKQPVSMPEYPKISLIPVIRCVCPNCAGTNLIPVHWHTYTCRCGNQAINTKKGWMWFGYIPLYKDSHSRG